MWPPWSHLQEAQGHAPGGLFPTGHRQGRHGAPATSRGQLQKAAPRETHLIWKTRVEFMKII